MTFADSGFPHTESFPTEEPYLDVPGAHVQPTLADVGSDQSVNPRSFAASHAAFSSSSSLHDRSSVASSTLSLFLFLAQLPSLHEHPRQRRAFVQLY